MGLMICIIASKLQTGKAEGPRNLPIVYREKGTRNPKAKKDLRSCAPNTKREVAVPSVHLLLTAPHPVGQADSLLVERWRGGDVQCTLSSGAQSIGTFLFYHGLIYWVDRARVLAVLKRCCPS